MNKTIKRMLSIALAAVVTLSGTMAVSAAQSPTTSVRPQTQTSVQSEKTSTGITVTVSTKADGTASVGQVAKTNKSNVKVSSTVTVNGVSYKVTAIGAKAFAECKKAKKIELPSTITTIGAKAFQGASKLKTITLTSKKAPKINKKAFKGVNTKKMTIKVSASMSKKQLRKLQKALKAAGFKGKIKQAKK